MPSPWPDDPTITDPTELFRRIPPRWWVADEKASGGFRPATAAFEDDDDGHPMSVFIEKLLSAPSDCLVGHADFRLVKFTAGFARSVKQRIAHDQENGGPAHAVVAGPKTYSTQKKFVAAAMLVDIA